MSEKHPDGVLSTNIETDPSKRAQQSHQVQTRCRTRSSAGVGELDPNRSDVGEDLNPEDTSPEAGDSNSSTGNNPKTSKVDMKAKLERSRQSARECRARKKLRYQYLEELVNKKERAVLALRHEIDLYMRWGEQVDKGVNPEEAWKLVIEKSKSTASKNA